MIRWHIIRITGKAAVTQLIIDRNKIAGIVEMVMQRFTDFTGIAGDEHGSLIHKISFQFR